MYVCIHIYTQTMNAFKHTDARMHACACASIHNKPSNNTNKQQNKRKNARFYRSIS